jgi:C_GCAxxG_C_C family probable redox protein
MVEDAMKRSRELFGSGWYCAESVVLAIAEHRDMPCKFIPRMATGFCSGMSRSGGACGAMSGAVLAIGLALGRDVAGQSLEACYAATREAIDGFLSRFGSDTCLGLTGCDLGTDEGQARFRSENMHERCLDFVAEATRLALTSIANHADTSEPRATDESSA